MYSNTKKKNLNLRNVFYARKMAPSPHANKGVNKKFMITLVLRNFIFLNASFNPFNGMIKKSPYSMSNRNGKIKVSAYCSIKENCPRSKPKPTANNIITVCNLSMIFICKSLLKLN